MAPAKKRISRGTKGKAASKPANPAVMTRNPSYIRTAAELRQNANDDESNAEAAPAVSATVEVAPTTSIRRSRAPSRTATVTSTDSSEPVRRSTRTRTVVQPAVKTSSRVSNRRAISKPVVKKKLTSKKEAPSRRSTPKSTEATETPSAPRRRVADRSTAKEAPAVQQEETTRRSPRTRTTTKTTASKSVSAPPRRAITKPKVKKTSAAKKNQPRRSILNNTGAKSFAEASTASRSRVANRLKAKKTPAARQQLRAPRNRTAPRRAIGDVVRREHNIGRRRSSSGSLYFPGGVPTYNGFTLTQHLYGYDMFDDTQADRYAEVICGRSPVATTYFFRGLNPGRRDQRLQ
uniref:Uncharacterized protein n=1 Tax=Panagrellus redivivus TaxID=6233 RepID=A0A7E4ULU4_PANRE